MAPPAAEPTQIAEASLARSREGFWTPADPVDGRVRLPNRLASIVTGLDRLLALFWNLWPLYLILVAAALYAAVWGYTSFYGPQFPRVPRYAWPFVPDSPNAVLAFVVGSLLLKAGWDQRPGLGGAAAAWFANYAAMVNAKVGVWTAFVLLYHYDHFFGAGGTRAAFQWLLVVSHVGMLAYAVLLFRKSRALPMAGYLAILAVGFLGDFMDYFFAKLVLGDPTITIFPGGVPNTPKIDVVALVTMGLTLVCTIVLAAAMRLRGPPVAR